MRAEYTFISGFRDSNYEPELVDVLGFVFGEYDPGYQRSGSKKCVLAIVADESGRIFQTELHQLKIPKKEEAND